MSAEGRSVSDVFQNIVRNIQEIVRSEIRLAKTEIQEEILKAKSATLLLGVGTLALIFGAFFLLLALVHTLTLVIPSWGAALIVGSVLVLVACLMLATSLKQWKHIKSTPEHTVESIKENISWGKQLTK